MDCEHSFNPFNRGRVNPNFLPWLHQLRRSTIYTMDDGRWRRRSAAYSARRAHFCIEVRDTAT